MVAFLFYVQRFFDPIRTLTVQYSIMQRAMASGQRIFEVLDVRFLVRQAANLKDGQHRIGRRRFELARCRAAVELRSVLAAKVGRQIGGGQ